MHAYDESYLKEVVETQGKLFGEVGEYESGIDVKNFIESYMVSKTRQFIDAGQAYVCTLNSRELWNYFCEVDQYEPGKGNAIGGFAADWVGQFYAYFQWYYNLASKKVLELVPLDFILAAYHGLHDLELDLAIRKVGEQIVE
ncbi:MAG: hypothetical protein K2K10_10770 [Acetatifactor sp.]|nr:hypothetical protein [Acetatifactor sp.]